MPPFFDARIVKINTLVLLFEGDVPVIDFEDFASVLFKFVIFLARKILQSPKNGRNFYHN